MEHLARTADREALPASAGSEAEMLRLVQSIVAMANTAGGQITVLPRDDAAGRRIEAAALEMLLHRHVAPAVHIELLPGEDGALVVGVRESERKPHLIIRDGRCVSDGVATVLFHRGQIWVRRAWGNAPATADDLQQLLLHSAGRLLERLGTQIRRPGFLLHEGDSAQPVRLVTDLDAPLVRADPDALYPLTRQMLCEEFHRPYGWISAALRQLGVEKDPELSYADRNSAGHPTRWRYAESVRDAIALQLAAHPAWDPAHESSAS